MKAKLPMGDGEEFIAGLEVALEEGDTQYIDHHMPRLERLIGQYQSRTYELARLEYRARLVREQHEPSAHNRTKKHGG